MKKVPEWLNNPNLVLLDNSTDKFAQQKNEEIKAQNKSLYQYQNHLEAMIKKRTADLQVAKEQAERADNLKTKFLEESLISTPTLALNLAKAEIIRMAIKVQRMVEQILIPFWQHFLPNLKQHFL